MLRKEGLIGLVLLVCCAGFAQAEVMSIQGADEIFDCYMDKGSVISDLEVLGLREYFRTGGDYDYRTFIRVDLSAIPEGATIDSASLNLKLKSTSNPITRVVDLWKVDPFTEGVTALTCDGVYEWPNGAGVFDGVDGGERTPSDRLLVTNYIEPATASGTVMSFGSDALNSYLQDQSDSAFDRYAYFQMSWNEGGGSNWCIFYSTESAGNEPSLALTYSVPEPMTLSLLAMGGVAMLRRKR